MRCAAGQGVVHFAQDMSPMQKHRKRYAIKFFISRAAFNAEHDLYRVPVLKKFLPKLVDVNNNDDCFWKDPIGRCVHLTAFVLATIPVRSPRTEFIIIIKNGL